MKLTWLKARLIPVAMLALIVAMGGVIRAATEQETDALELPGVIEHLLGKQSDRDDQKECRIRSTDSSYLGIVNQLSCALDALGINGATGPAGVTKRVATHRGALVVHVQVNSGATVGTASYDWAALVWACNLAASACTQTTDFQPVFYWAFSNSSDGSINKGALAHYFGLGHDTSTTTTGALRVVYDVGSATPTTDVTAFVYDTAPSFDRERMSTSGITIVERDEVRRTGTVSDITQLLHSTSWDRVVSIELDSATNTGGFYMEGNFRTLPAVGTAAPGTTPAPAACFKRQADGAGDDFDFVIDPTNTSCSAAQLPTYPQSSLSSETTVSIATLPGTSAPLNNMPATPPSL